MPALRVTNLRGDRHNITHTRERIQENAYKKTHTRERIQENAYKRTHIRERMAKLLSHEKAGRNYCSKGKAGLHAFCF